MNLGTCGHTDLYEKCKKESNLCTCNLKEYQNNYFLATKQ